MGSSDIEDTGKRRAVRALQLSEERFRLLVDSVVDYAIFMLNTEGRVQSWNAGAERIKGYTEDEILDQHLSVFYTEEDHEAGLPYELLGIAEEEGRVERSGWRVRKDGSRFWADVVITALRDDDGTLVGFAKVTRDMTSAHEAQTAREYALHEQQRVVERLEELDEWRRGFISSVTHDLQTPVAAIVGFADIMMNEEVPESERRDLLERIRSNAHTLEDLIEHLRTFSSLESGRVELTFERLDLMAEIEGLVSEMEPVLAGRQVEVDVDGIEVSADRRGLQRIVQNLLNNAVRHSGTDASILVRAATMNGTVVIEVVDDGEGIPEPLLPLVFDRYKRGRRGGTGLGLSIVKQYVELHGGVVSVESAEGVGSTFRFTLPAA